MSLFRTILLATDFSEPSEAAYLLAYNLARLHLARLVAAHVVQTPVLADVGGDPTPETESWLREVREKLHDLRPAYPTIAVEHRLLEGEPAEQIVRLANELNCDLIVLGTHARSGLPRLVLGSVAEEVLRSAPCPVLIVKASRPARPLESDSAGRPCRVESRTS